jgi:hypothetical protein
MDFEKLKKYIELEQSRDSRPMHAYTDLFMSLLLTIKDLEKAELEESSKELTYSLMVPHIVTAMEVYFRDSLSAIFRLCKYESFSGKLNNLLKKKYSVDEIIELESEGLHFLQVIPSEMSFQSIQSIGGNYDNFFTSGFINEIQKNQFRYEHLPESIMSVTSETLASVAELFSTRHEIIHNPNSTYLSVKHEVLNSFTEASLKFVFCANMVIEDFIMNNAKKKLNKTEQVEA